jgi:hypothetical protein
MVPPIEMSGKKWERVVRFRERAPSVAILRAAEEARGEPRLVLDERVDVFAREEKADHRVGEQLLVEPAQNATHTFFAARVVP